MGVQEEFNKVLNKQFDISEYEDMGKNLVLQILNHIGMVRYDDVKLKDFDITNTDIGYLVDKSIFILGGIESSGKGKKRYVEALNGLITCVIGLRGSGKERSVVTSLKKEFETELRRWNVEDIDYSDIWEL